MKKQPLIFNADQIRLVFINPALRPDNVRIHLPVGLAHVMTETQKAGFEFDLIDMDIDNLSIDDLRVILERKLYDVYAFGCMVTGFKFARQISSIIKSINPPSTIVAGNTVASSIPEILLRTTEVDVAVLGEGDVTFVDLLDALRKRENLASVSGIAFKEDGRLHFTSPRPILRDLDEIGFPNWDLFQLDKYPKKIFLSDEPDLQGTVAFPLNHARGCPFDCTFCSSVFTKLKYRCNSEIAVRDEIQRLHDRYNCNYILLWDELTFPNIPSVRRMIDQLQSFNFFIRWNPTVRGNLFKSVHKNLLRDLKLSGCDYINYSLESADPQILEAMRKRMTVAEFIEQTDAVWRSGITPISSVVFGYPQETLSTIQKTLDVCERCDLYPSAGFLLPLPRTPIYEWARRAGRIPNEVAYLEAIGDRQDFHINLTNMSDEEFVDAVLSKLTKLADKQGLQLESPLKTGAYRIPKTRWTTDAKVA